MADALHDLLAPLLKSQPQNELREPSAISSYLNRLTSLSLASLATIEPESLSQAANSNTLSLRALASRSARSTVASAEQLETLSDALPAASSSITQLRDSIPNLDDQAVQFSSTYSKSRDDNIVLDRRKNAMLLSRQVDKVSEILELPSLLSTAISSAGTASSTGAGANYSQALDLYAHIKRLQILYPESALVQSVLREADNAMKDMKVNLIMSLRSPNIRLATAIRTIGFLRRVAPELAGHAKPETTSSTHNQFSALPDTQSEGHYGALFLTARLANLLMTLDALSPLRDLADQETAHRLSTDPNPKLSKGQKSRRTSSTTSPYTTTGQQTERYLKRYIEIFREHSFSAISMYRNIFPQPEPAPTLTGESISSDLLTPPSALATFPLHLVALLIDTLQAYLPNITDPQARESLLMQVLYAANSLGRLGADFSMILALLEEDLPVAQTPKTAERHSGEEGDDKVDGEDEKVDDAEEVKDSAEKGEKPEWVRVMEKHRVQAARLEALASGQERSVSITKEVAAQ